MSNPFWNKPLPAMPTLNRCIIPNIIEDLKTREKSMLCPFLNHHEVCKSLFPNLEPRTDGLTWITPYVCPCQSKNYSTRYLINVLNRILRETKEKSSDKAEKT